MEACLSGGVDQVGLNFVPGSSRQISPELAASLADQVRGRIQVVGVFRNQTLAEIRDIARAVRLDAVQLHGEESPQFCNEVPLPVWKAFGVSFGWDPSVVSRYRGLAVRLFDTASQGASGGTGRTFDWALLPQNLPHPWYLAGGLNLENLDAAVAACHPDGLDLNSGLETSPGVKSPALIAKAMERLAAHRTSPSGKPGQALPPMEIDGLSWPAWELPSRKAPGDGETLWILELLSSNGGRLLLDLRRREGDPTEIISGLMGIQMAARSRGGKLKFRLSESVLKALLSASLATVLDIVD